MRTLGDKTNNDTNTFQITKTELHLPVVILNTTDIEELSELLSKGLKDQCFGMNIKVN